MRLKKAVGIAAAVVLGLVVSAAAIVFAFVWIAAGMSTTATRVNVDMTVLDSETRAPVPDCLLDVDGELHSDPNAAHPPTRTDATGRRSTAVVAYSHGGWRWMPGQRDRDPGLRFYLGEKPRYGTFDQVPSWSVVFRFKDPVLSREASPSVSVTKGLAHEEVLNPPAGKQWRLAGVDPVATDGTPALERTTVRIEANRYGGEEYRIPLTVFLDRNEIAACQATTSSETEARASRLFNDRKFAGALPVFQELVQMGRSGAWAQRGVAESLSRLGRRKEAVQAYRRALELKPDDRDSLYWYANSLIGMDDKEAVVQFRKLITQEPGDARGEIGLANALYGLDRFPETVEALARARELCATCLNDNDRLIEADARRLSR